jgi:hypothetical protein
MISEPDIKITDFGFSLAYIGQNLYFKAYYVFIFV